MSKSLASGEITAERYSSYIDALWPKIIKKEVDENGADVLRYPTMKQRTWLNRCACCSWLNDTDVYVLGDKQWGYMDVVEYEGNDNILEMARAVCLSTAPQLAISLSNHTREARVSCYLMSVGCELPKHNESPLFDDSGGCRLLILEMLAGGTRHL